MYDDDFMQLLGDHELLLHQQLDAGSYAAVWSVALNGSLAAAAKIASSNDM